MLPIEEKNCLGGKFLWRCPLCFEWCTEALATQHAFRSKIMCFWEKNVNSLWSTKVLLWKCQHPWVQSKSRTNILSADLTDLPSWFQELHSHEVQQVVIGHPINVKDPHPQKECGSEYSGFLVFVLGKNVWSQTILNLKPCSPGAALRNFGFLNYLKGESPTALTSGV